MISKIFQSTHCICDLMTTEQKRKRKPKKIYRTVIKLTPPSDPRQSGGEPDIEIDSKALRPKMIKSKSLPVSEPRGIKRPKPRRPRHGEKPFKLAERYDEKLIQEMEWSAVTSKTRWKCIRCGWCCSHSWRVNLTWKEYDCLKDRLPISEVVVDPNTGMSHPIYMIKSKCVQYDQKTHKCKIYKNRAYSCATFPFSLTPRGKLVRSKYCKGFGKGKLVDRKEMRQYIFKWRKRAGIGKSR
jgi:Fe-S-cluster containining protein